MTHSQACTDLVASFEGCKLTAYQDQRGIWTIGYGHAINVKEGDTCTADQALTMLSLDLMTADGAVGKAVTVPILQNQFDALVSLAFNIGGGNFAHSTLVSLLNQKAYDGASAQFLVWCKTNGVDNPGLLRRRKAEQALFNTPDEIPMDASFPQEGTMKTNSYPAPIDLDAKIDQLKSLGVTVTKTTDTTGEITHGSYDLTYSISGGKIAVTEVHKPGLVPDSMVWDKIAGFFGAAE